MSAIGLVLAIVIGVIGGNWLKALFKLIIQALSLLRLSVSGQKKCGVIGKKRRTERECSGKRTYTINRYMVDFEDGTSLEYAEKLAANRKSPICEGDRVQFFITHKETLVPAQALKKSVLNGFIIVLIGAAIIAGICVLAFISALVAV